MSLTPSQMISLGSSAPDFSLREVTSSETITLASFQEKKALLVMFICKHCPFVVHIEKELARLGLDYQESELGILAISSNDVLTHPEDSPENLKKMAQKLGFVFPFCCDETQEVAKAYQAACTPDFFLYDKDRLLVYRGQLDESRPQNGIPPSGRDLRAAIEAVLEDRVVNPDQKNSIGCNIKWKRGNEPE